MEPNIIQALISAILQKYLFHRAVQVAALFHRHGGASRRPAEEGRAREGREVPGDACEGGDMARAVSAHVPPQARRRRIRGR